MIRKALMCLVLLVVLIMSTLPVMTIAGPTANGVSGQSSKIDWVWSEDGWVCSCEGGSAARTLITGDFDEDGIPDLVAVSATISGSSLMLYRGNSKYASATGDPQNEGAIPPFGGPETAVEMSDSVDFAYSGDFNADGHLDIAVAAAGGRSLTMLPGDGQGQFNEPQRIELPGVLTAMAAGDINREDGLTDLVVGTDKGGDYRVLVFEGPDGALSQEPEGISLTERPLGFALGQLDNQDPTDLAVVGGAHLFVIRGRDRELTIPEEYRSEVEAPVVLDQRLPFEAIFVVAGDFLGGPEHEIATADADGSLLILERSGESDGARLPGEEWSVSRSEKASSGLRQLLAQRVSALEKDDLVAFGADNRIDVMNVGSPAFHVDSHPLRWLSNDSELAAALPTQINSDAISDLITFKQIGEGEALLRVDVSLAEQIFTVRTTGDDDVIGTLRHAIGRANQTPGLDEIRFAIPGAGVKTIHLESSLPPIVYPVIIDGRTQPGYSGTPLIEIDGTGAEAGANGLTLSAPGCVVRGLAINSFRYRSTGGRPIGGSGIQVYSANNLIAGNFIGTDPTGTSIRPNWNGITVEGNYNAIGGTAAGARNLISGNRQNEVLIEYGHSGTLIQGNYVGTNVSGNSALGGAGNGVAAAILSYGMNTSVGGTAPGARNVISGNSSSGVFIYQGKVQGNYVGVNATGNAAVPNSDTGVASAGGTTIGGTTPAARNVISANTYGVTIDNTSAATLVQGNYIGTNANGTGAIGNRRDGILLGGLFPVRNASIGGMTRSAGNTIAFNGGNGVVVYPATSGSLVSSRNLIMANSISGNAKLGIDLIDSSGEGVTPNDPGDTDAGANGLQNFPVLSSAVRSAAAITISGTLNSASNATFTIEFFHNHACDSSAHGEGRYYIGYINVRTNGAGNAAFSATFPYAPPAGEVITATATPVDLNTSEFSHCVVIR
ncbi:MAG TPA: hypothetical protein VFV34_21185 [Blastocatellia bacterium]|nr:hypothetical protein [Blastocatellia bacterium]